jgi:hypothetical protein
MRVSWRRLLHLASTDGVPVRAFWVAVVVGTALNLINQGDAIAHGHPLNWAKIVLTYAVPYAVSTHGALTARSSRPRGASSDSV